MRKLITPQDAKKILANNINNRRLDVNNISFLTQQMENNEFIYTGEAIKVATDGTLIDGQHRLLACIKSGKTMDVEFIDDLDKEIFTKLDTGKKRTANDVFYMEGIPNHTGMTAITKKLLFFSIGKLRSNTSVVVTNKMILDIFNSNENVIHNSYNEIRTFYKKGQHLITTSLATAVAVALIMSGENKEVVMDFFRELYTGESGGSRIKSTSAINVRNKIITVGLAKDKELPTVALTAYLFSAYKLYKAGSLSKKFSTPRSNINLIPFKLKGFIR